MRGALLRGITALLLCGILLFSLCACGFTYAEGDTDKYLTLSEDLTDTLSVTLPRAYEVTDDDVEETIRELLLSEKKAVEGAERETDKEIGYGDVAALYYSGVTEDGVYVTDGFAVGDAVPYLVEVGGGSFPVSEVEAALSGLIPAEYALRESGTVPAGAVVYIDGSYEDTAGGISRGTNYIRMARVDLSMADEVWGNGFAAQLTGQSAGADKTLHFTLPDAFSENGTPVSREYKLRVRFVSEKELTVEGTYPADYSIEERAGKRVVFTIQLAYMVDYEVPELTAENVISLFGISDTESDPVAAFRAKVRQTLLSQEERQAALYAALWEELKTHVTVREMPQKQVKKILRGLTKELKELYEYCKTNLYDACTAEWGEEAMADFDAFARAVYGGAEGEDAETVLTREAEDEVTQTLVLYAVARRFGFLPDQASRESGAQTVMADLLEESDLTERQLRRRWGGDEYFESLYCRSVILETLAARAQVSYT